MALLGSISGVLPLQPLNILDQVTLQIAGVAVPYICKNAGFEASLVAVVDGTVEVKPNGKIYRLKLKLKVKVGTAYVFKIFLVEVFAPFFDIPTAVSFQYVEDVGI